MQKVRVLLFFSFLCSLATAQDKMPETELLVRRFVHALIDKNEANLRALCLDHHNLKVLWTGEKKNEAERDQLKRELSKLDIDWLKEGENFRWNGKVFSVNENMITKRHQIARVKMIEYGFPIHISKVGGAWYIQPLFIINIYQREIAVESKKNRRNYTVLIEGQEIPLNENEEGVYKTADGKELKVSMHKNLFQNYEDQDVRISYSRDLNLSKNREKDCNIYRFKSELTPSIMIQVYKPGTKLEPTKKYVVNSIIENYEAMEYTLKSPPSRDIKYSPKPKVFIDGKEVRSLRNGVQYIDHMYFWEENGRIIAAILQMEISDSVAGVDYFNHIMKEIELKFSSK
ncbi:hypothetical protein PQO01_04495 [Lentisphaera marina]|uniref:hypothetical protein n=1 Tax=Lentisphaera marina TaxID=1111041 RepID=UPI0023652104|nr:hypothetical protein [Lentisphaera marina]MDD7984203.1 hypothetical protein [Lentisphaera marina]